MARCPILTSYFKIIILIFYCPESYEAARPHLKNAEEFSNLDDSEGEYEKRKDSRGERKKKNLDMDPDNVEQSSGLNAPPPAIPAGLAAVYASNESQKVTLEGNLIW